MTDQPLLRGLAARLSTTEDTEDTEEMKDMSWFPSASSVSFVVESFRRDG